MKEENKALQFPVTCREQQNNFTRSCCTSMPAEEIVVRDWSGFGERVELVDPLTGHVEFHEAALKIKTDTLIP